MRVLVALNHPAHYHVFKRLIKKLRLKQNSVLVVIRSKDVLEELLVSDKIPYKILSKKREKSSGRFTLFLNSLEFTKHFLLMSSYALRFRPHILIGTDMAIGLVSQLLRSKSIVVNEDDFNANTSFCKVAYPFATKIVAPNYTEVGRYRAKKINYNGIQKMTYLNDIEGSRTYLKNLFSIENNENYVIIRIVSLTAGHDINASSGGISINLLEEIIDILLPKFSVLISSEKGLPSRFDNYLIKGNRQHVHLLMRYASFFIGDSQSMCAEAGILGVPFVRFNDFVDKISYLRDLEEVYRLGWGFTTKQRQMFLQRVKFLVDQDNMKREWETKRTRLFNDKEDLTDILMILICHGQWGEHRL